MRRLTATLVALVMVIAATPTDAYAYDWSVWISRVNGKKVQYSTYGPYEGETITATGKRITNNTKYVAVPMQYIVKKSAWRKHKSLSYRKTHFYYGEKIQLKRWSKKRKRWIKTTATVEDCGGFKGYGGKYERLFDLTPAVYRALGVGRGVGIVRWRYAR